MTDHMVLQKSHIIETHTLYIERERNCSEMYVPVKSPRYARKRRIPIGQARRLQSQPAAGGKISGKTQCSFDEKCSSLVINNLISRKSDISITNSEKDKFKNIPIQLSASLPVMNCKSLSVISSHKSCDNLFICNTKYYKTLRTEHNVLPVDNTFKDSVKSNDSIAFNNSVSECSMNIGTNSRRSSTSTVRERHSSQDSAFSQISIIDPKEVAELAVKADEESVWKPHHSRSRSDASSEVFKNKTEGSEVFSLPSSFSNTGLKKKSIFEGQQVTVSTECFFPRPHEGQSITSFLSSADFSISAELDRENAHFCISDALIAAIEHMKCSRTKQIVKEVVDDDESDEEIRKLTQRIRIRRRERQREKVMKSIVLLSDGKTDTTSQSASPPVSSHSSDYDIDSLCSEDEVEDLELSTNTDSNLNSMKENGLALSMASLYSEADIHKAQLLQKEAENKKLHESDSVNLTAESVALSLLRKFSEKHLPKASDLQWLVSEQEAPQRLLPLPDSYPVSPDAIEEEYNLSKTRLRGNSQWAPPRPQIIFFIHPYMDRKEIIEKQKFRCAGCGMRIEKNYIKRFRYCEYFGKYFCQCCHSNNQAYIPGRILFKWNFSKYYVSKFAWEFLDQMFSDPLFNVEYININLYQKAKQLDLCRYYRMQLFYIKDFIRTCRKAETIQCLLETTPCHIIAEPHCYSLSDFMQVKSGELSKHLSMLVNQCVTHIKQCILCQAKGFICEICQKDSDIIFPFQFDKVILCQKCGSCFHKRCCKKVKCPKCKRIQERKDRLAACKSEDEL